MGDTSGALQQFEAALQASPDDARAHFSLAVLLRDGGRYDEAVAHFSAALKTEPNYIAAPPPWRWRNWGGSERRPTCSATRSPRPPIPTFRASNGASPIIWLSTNTIDRAPRPSVRMSFQDDEHIGRRACFLGIPRRPRIGDSCIDVKV
jgi:tetratricopeptide (TPR) repeat protein